MKTNSQLCGRLWGAISTMALFPPALSLDSGNRCPTAAPGALVSCSQKRKFVTHPSTSPPLWPVVMVTAGSEMAFHQKKKKKKAPTPLCLSAPFLWPVAPLLSAKDPLSTLKKKKKLRWPRAHRATRLLSSLTQPLHADGEQRSTWQRLGYQFKRHIPFPTSPKKISPRDSW